MSDEPRGPFFAWQWRLYPDGHRDRTNLIIHVITQPIFVAGIVLAIVGPLTGAWWLLGAGLAAIAVAAALQGRGHKREAVPPAPFRGPGDVARRLFAEQLFTFPRYLLSGGLARAWRQSGSEHEGSVPSRTDDKPSR